MSALQLMMARARMNHVSTGGDSVYANEFLDKVVAYYPFEDDVDTVVGDSNPFSTGAPPTLQAAKVGNGAKLNGVIDTSNYVPSLSTTKFSMGGWFKISQSALDIFTGRNNSGGAYETATLAYFSPGLRFSVYSGTSYYMAHTSIVPNPSLWYFIVGTYDGSMLQCYVNEVMSGSAACTTQAQAGTKLELGYAYSGRYGVIADEVFICDDALTPECIAYLYNSGNGKSWEDINNDK